MSDATHVVSVTSVNRNSRCLLDRLPEEIVIRVLLFSNYQSILRFSTACKKYYAIVSSSVVLQFHVELEANGLRIAEDLLEGDQDHLSLLRKLRRYRDAWLDLDISSPVQHYCGHERLCLWELQGGVFAKAIAKPGASSPSLLILFPLDATENTRVDFGCAFNEFTFDPSQNLVVLVGIEPNTSNRAWVHFCSSVTGQAHPQAKHPSLTAELGLDVLLNTIYDIVLEMKGELVAIQFSSFVENSYEILVWNWKTGTLISKIGHRDGVGGFGFLDNYRLALWSAYGADSDGFRSVELLVYELFDSKPLGTETLDERTGATPSVPLEPNPVLVFRFPKLQTSSKVCKRGFLIRSDYGSAAGLATLVPFTNPHALTLSLAMAIVFEGTHHFSFRIFIDAYQLLRHLDQAKEQGVTTLAWENWGEHATRWFRADPPDSWIHWLSGSRSVTRHRHISVLDFHTPTVRRYADRWCDTYISLDLLQDQLEERESAIHDGKWPAYFRHDRDESIISDSLHGTHDDTVLVDTVGSSEFTLVTHFDEPVVSRLPYRIVTRVHRGISTRRWLISGNHLVGLSYEFGFEESRNRMTVYTIGDPDRIAD